jgi:hypothetical protein
MLIAQITDIHLRPSGLPAYRVAETARVERFAGPFPFMLDAADRGPR